MSTSETRLPADFGNRLLDWYQENARDLPWRGTRDPYAILVSELMLQQTRVETVRGRYTRFLERFPDFETLAAADVDEVLAEWSGLGYYRRARALHALAGAVVEDHGGKLPENVESLRELPGVGPYTAAAVASIVYGLPELAIDGNIARVLCRLAAIEEDPSRSSVRIHLREMSSDQLAAHPAGEFNQALMELGARVCVPRSPRCAACPVADMCAARWLGIESQIPPPRQQTVQEVSEESLLVEEDGRFFLARGQRPGVLQDMWELPTLDSRIEAGSFGDYLSRQGWRFERGEMLGEIRHGITDRRIHCRVYRGHTAGEGDPNRPCNGPSQTAAPVATGWFTIEEIAKLPLAASARKTFEEVLGVDLTRG